jgi:hypothetical protein
MLHTLAHTLHLLVLLSCFALRTCCLDIHILATSASPPGEPLLGQLQMALILQPGNGTVRGISASSTVGSLR